ncbi:hypothetical protein [Paenibacillus sp. FSL R5-0490]|uniref:hypothetical protein n=1 Tax=Paenibacillus sp. FSL R5-0490 TaxID=1920424 RepID=UPI00257126E6|nr:hypothetical protein [Paenibacillus sp. FSL R5-0490]
MLYFLLLGFLFIGAVLFIILKKININTAAMAAVMAFGIVTQGVLLNYFGMPFFLGSFGKILSIADLALWLAFLVSIGMTIFKGEFKKLHYVNPINRFGIGTWVAGTSICGIMFFRQFGAGAEAQALAILNAGLWAVYIWISIRGFKELGAAPFGRQTHGVLLLTTVSTQSLVLLFNTVFKEVPVFLNAALIFTGLLFYFISAWFILKRYAVRGWNLAKDWNNTNCIFHGALSISGLAMFKSGIAAGSAAMWFWLAVFLVFIIVEAIEIIRLVWRIRMFGLKEGIFTYDVTQWSRIFTFAMFFTFTFFIESPLQAFILNSGVWIILLLLVIEIYLSADSLRRKHVQVPAAFGKETSV